VEIRKVTGDKRAYLSLLLLADEQEDMIDRYLDRGDMYVLTDGDSAVGECVVTDEGDGMLEIQSLAVDTEHQGKGYGRRLIGFVEETYRGKFSVLQVGTGDSPLTVPFYEKCGFAVHHVEKDFILEHYDHPIFEGGKQLIDKVYLRKALERFCPYERRNNAMIFGIVGLGLIGGSLARSIKFHSEHTVLGCDLNETALLQARMVNAIDGELTAETLPQCDAVLIALYPQAAVDWALAHEGAFKPGALVVDCCGVKRFVCDRLFPAFEHAPFTFMGGHPMAGRERSGFSYAQDDLFENASMILCPMPGTDVETVRQAKEMFLSIGFGRVRFTTPLEHDEMIAFTSQLAHVVSGAYVKAPLAVKHKGFSAGSFRDMTRVARLNEEMWTELFLENGDLLLEQTQGLIDRLTEYRDALRDHDAARLRDILRQGREIKEALED